MKSQNTPETRCYPAGLSNPARRALAGAGYTHLSQLAGVRESDLRKLHGMGPKALDLLRSALNSQGLSFAPDYSQKG